MSRDDHADGGDDLGTSWAPGADSLDEFSDRARLQTLFETRHEAAEAIRRAPIRELELEHKTTEYNPQYLVDRIVRAGVTAYILEAEPLLRNTEPGRELWSNHQLRPVHLPEYAPAHPDGEWEHVSMAEPAGIDAGRDADMIQLEGLGDYVTLPDPIELDYTGLLNRPDHSDTVTVTTRIGVDRETSTDVFRALNKLLADLGIGLDAETAEDTEASYDYGDLI